MELDQVLRTPILRNPITENPIDTQPVDSKIFQDKVLLNMKEMISILKESQPITQNNDYSLYANNDVELLQEAKNQSLNDLVDVINGVTGKFLGG